MYLITDKKQHILPQTNSEIPNSLCVNSKFTPIGHKIVDTKHSTQFILPTKVLRHYPASARLSVKSTTSIRFAVIRKDDTPTSASPRTNMPIIPSQLPFFCEPVPPSMDFRKTLLRQSPRHENAELINVRKTKEELNSLGL